MKNQDIKYIIDIDNTICTQTTGDYEIAIPYFSRIAKINKLYDEGNTIIYYTARGMSRNNGNIAKCYEQFYVLTRQQLIKWGCKFHELRLGKQLYHYWIDDKAINSEVFFNEEI